MLIGLCAQLAEARRSLACQRCDALIQSAIQWAVHQSLTTLPNTFKLHPQQVLIGLCAQLAEARRFVAEQRCDGLIQSAFQWAVHHCQDPINLFCCFGLLLSGDMPSLLCPRM